MLVTVTKDIHLTPTELATEFWNMDTCEQISTLHCIFKRFTVNPNQGELQLGSIANKLNNESNYNEYYRAEVKAFVTKLYEYLVKED